MNKQTRLEVLGYVRKENVLWYVLNSTSWMTYVLSHGIELGPIQNHEPTGIHHEDDGYIRGPSP